MEPNNPRNMENKSYIQADFKSIYDVTISLTKVGVQVMMKTTVTIMKSFVNLRRDNNKAVFVSLVASVLNQT